MVGEVLRVLPKRVARVLQLLRPAPGAAGLQRASATALTAAVDAGVAELGRLGIVLANAGISATSTLLKMIEINLSGQ